MNQMNWQRQRESQDSTTQGVRCTQSGQVITVKACDCYDYDNLYFCLSLSLSRSFSRSFQCLGIGAPLVCTGWLCCSLSALIARPISACCLWPFKETADVPSTVTVFVNAVCPCASNLNCNKLVRLFVAAMSCSHFVLLIAQLSSLWFKDRAQLLFCLFYWQVTC